MKINELTTIKEELGKAIIKILNSTDGSILPVIPAFIDKYIELEKYCSSKEEQQ